ncbi:MAG: hypothetical protein ACR2M7_02770 [Bdellovibrionales bacterium]
MFFSIFLFFSFQEATSLTAEQASLLQNISQKKGGALASHNEALKHLDANEPYLSIFLLRKNFYENLFFPSYLSLKSLKSQASFGPFLWHIGSLIFAILSVFLFYFSFQGLFRKKLFKIWILWFCGLTICFASGFLSLRKRMTNFEDLDLLNAPFKEALLITQVKQGSDLMVLKEEGQWLQVQTHQHKGWLLKKDLLPILE